MRTYLTIITFVFALVSIATIVACGDDRPVYSYDNAADAGVDGSTTTGGGTVGTTSDSNWLVFSFDVNKSDAYNDFGWVDSRNNEALTCFNDTACKTKMMNNDASQRWQYLGDGYYSESFSGNMGGFTLVRNNSNCGNQITAKAGTTSNLWGTVKLSSYGTTSKDSHFRSSSVTLTFGTGDGCAPAGITILAENAFSMTSITGGSGTSTKSLNLAGNSGFGSDKRLALLDTTPIALTHVESQILAGLASPFGYLHNSNSYVQNTRAKIAR